MERLALRYPSLNLSYHYWSLGSFVRCPPVGRGILQAAISASGERGDGVGYGLPAKDLGTTDTLKL